MSTEPSFSQMWTHHEAKTQSLMEGMYATICCGPCIHDMDLQFHGLDYLVAELEKLSAKLVGFMEDIKHEKETLLAGTDDNENVQVQIVRRANTSRKSLRDTRRYDSKLPASRRSKVTPKEPYCKSELQQNMHHYSKWFFFH
jgi:hypothetical protein